MTEKNNNNNSSPKTSSVELVAKQNWLQPEEKTQKNLLKILDEVTSDYRDIQLNEQEAAILNKQLRKMSIGSAGFSPMHCSGSQCPFASRCPLVQMAPSGHPHHGKAPVGQPCILEMTMFRDATTSYMKEYDVHPQNFTEFNIVTELAEIEVLQWRLNMALALPQNATLVIDQVVSIDPTTGQPITQQQVSPLFEQKQKLANRKTKLIKLMVGDRQEKYKKEAALKQRPEDDAATAMSKLKKDLQKLSQNINKQLKDVGPIIDVEVVTPNDLINMAGDELESGRDSQSED